MHRTLFNSRRILVAVLLPLLVLMSACSSPSNQPKTYTIGVLVQAPTLVAVIDGFKSGLAALGYVEGKNVTYAFDGPTNTIEALKPEAEKLKAQKLDMLITIGTPSTQAAKEVFAGTNVPILFGPVVTPVELGFAASLRNPGGNMTGILSTDTVGKALEWLGKIVPTAKRIYVPQDLQDKAAAQSLQSLTDAAKTLGMELVISTGSTPEELDAITKTIPENVDAVFLLRSSSIGVRVSSLTQAANARHLASASSDIGSLLSAGAMVGYGPGYSQMGQQLSRFADKVLKGTAPGTLPIENAEAYLGINLQTAQAIGVEIPESILQQATQIVRPPSK